MVISGTLAGKILNEIKDVNAPYEVQLMENLIDICTDSWFNQHKPMIDHAGFIEFSCIHHHRVDDDSTSKLL